MLGAVMFGHKQLPAGDRGDHPPRREGRQGAARLPAGRITPTLEKAVLDVAEADLRAAYKITDKQERYAAVDAAKAKVDGALCRPRAASRASTRAGQGDVFKELQAKVVRWNILDTGTRIDGRDLEDRPPDRGRGRRPAAHPRLGAVHPRRDAGAGRRHARHRRRRAVHRRAGRHLQGDLPAALQLPALLGRRDRPHGLARPPRDRPRQARLARHPPDAAAGARVPLHASASSPRSPSRTARPRWRRSAAPRWR